jgi:RNA polymerase sigma-70 factor (ECF subfamily)
MSTSPQSHGADRPEGRFFGWITRLVHDHRRHLVAVAQREGLTADDALDCAQEAFQSFLLLPQARLLVEEADDSIKLLTVLVRNIARNQRRRHHRARPHGPDAIEGIEDGGDAPDAIVARAETYVTAVGCMATLGQIQKAVVELRLVDDVPGEDVAAVLGTSTSNVAVLLHRAKAKLRSCIVDGAR